MAERAQLYLLAGAYVLGLVLAGWTWGWFWLGVLALVGAILSFRVYSLPGWPLWMIAGLLAIAAGPYLHLRTPRPAPQDISRQAPQQALTLQGEVVEAPRLRGGAQRFILKLQTMGQLYVRAPTVPSVRVGDRLRITGSLGLPLPASNPDAFDFRAYLQRKAIFATFQAERVRMIVPASPYRLDRLREYLLAIHKRALGPEAGALFGSLVLGAEAVDLSAEVQERYRSVGLAHLLAASGTQVSLVLAAALALSARQRSAVRVVLATVALLLFVCLSGATPAILRAAGMGAVAILGLALDRRSHPLGALVFVGWLLLLANPLWIWDLGFDFSFLATLGLVISAPWLGERFGELPPLISSGLAVTLAAALWTLPLQLLDFGQWSPYAIPLNLLAAPCIEVLTLGGMATSLLALVSPDLAGFADRLLLPILQLLDWMAIQVSGWPGSLLTPGLLLPGQMILLYGLLVAAHRLRPVWPLGLATGLVLILPGVVFPGSRASLVVLSAGRAEMLVLETHRHTLIIGSGDGRAVEGVLVPYLERRGRLALDGMIVLGKPAIDMSGWEALVSAVEVPRCFDGTQLPWTGAYQKWLASLSSSGIAYERLQADRLLTIEDGVEVQMLGSESSVLLLKTGPWQMLLLGRLGPREQEWLTRVAPEVLARVNLLWTSGKRLDAAMTALPALRGVLVSGHPLSQETARRLADRQIPVWNTAEHGGLRWQGETPNWRVIPTFAPGASEAVP